MSEAGLVGLSRPLPPPSQTYDNAAYRFFRGLGSPQRVVAPMVDGSELPYRLLCRRHGAQLAYSPMLKAGYVVTDPRYLPAHFTTCAADRPLVAQLCGDDPELLLAAARQLAPHCDAIDLNLGCPQTVARREHFGAFLLDDWALLRRIVTTLSAALPVPVTCKLRRLPDPRHTVALAQLLVDSGAQLLAVHGRTREQKKEQCSVADWDVVRMVKDSVQVPVLVNGNVLVEDDLHAALAATGCDGVMVAEALLWDPRLFSAPPLPLLSGRLWALPPPADRLALDLMLEYLDLCASYPTRPDIMKRHAWWLLHHALPGWEEMEDVLHYEGLEAPPAYWTRVEAMVRRRRAAYPETDRVVESPIEPLAGPQPTGGVPYDGPSHAELLAALRATPPPARPLLPHREEAAAFRVNGYKREVRAQCKAAGDQLAGEDFEGLDLFGPD